ncbi:hypothetical protein ACHAWC_006309 [Mediolabrus comicus]
MITMDEYDANLGYHSSVVPLDIRLGITSANSTKQLRWGILATGKVAHDFTQVLKFLRGIRNSQHDIVAVGSRTIDRAQSFARLHNIPMAYGSYQELCHDPNVDIVYIASLHPDHKVHAEMALNCGKHVLVEKPMTMKAEDAQYLYDLGREKQLFVGEGMWTRFFPAVEWTRSLLGVDEERCNDNDDNDANELKKIGNVRVIQADFSIDGDDVGPYPTDSLYATELGGGTAWVLLPYIVGSSLLPFNGRLPDRIAANGIIPADAYDVGDVAFGMTMTFEIDNEGQQQQQQSSPPGNKAIASGVCGFIAESCEETMYAAKHGRITLNGPAHCPTSATLIRKSSGRGNGATSGSDVDPSAQPKTITVEFPLPASTKELEDSGGIQMPNSMGFMYEIEAVRRLIAAKHYTFPQWTPEESVNCIKIIEKMLSQIID